MQYNFHVRIFYQEIVIYCLNDKKYNIRIYKYNITCYYIDHTGIVAEKHI